MIFKKKFTFGTTIDIHGFNIDYKFKLFNFSFYLS